MRHPNFLAFRDSHEVVEKGTTNIYLITQLVKPLKLVLEELALEGQQRCVCKATIHYNKAQCELGTRLGINHRHFTQLLLTVYSRPL